MKKIILITFFTQTNFVYSQDYYWNGDKKVKIRKDYSSYIVYDNDTVNDTYKQEIKNIRKQIDSPKTKKLDNYSIIKHNQNAKQDYDKIPKKKGIEKSYGIIFEDNDTCYLTNYLVLKLKDLRYLDNLNSILRNYDALIYSTDYGYIIAKVAEINNVITCSNAIYESNIVKWCHPDFLSEVRVNGWRDQYYLDNRKGCSYYGNDIGTSDAWKITKGCPEIIVAVIDDGVEDHPDLKDENGNNRILAGKTYIGNTTNGRPDVGSKHGQACAGIIAASHNDNIKGIAPNIKILPVNIGSNGSYISSSKLAEAINWAYYNGADILSNSWNTVEVAIVKEAIENAKIYGRNGKGTIIVFSAGNDGGIPVYGYPKYAIAVGALNQKDELACEKDIFGNKFIYTNVGTHLDLMAYGGDVSSNGDGDIRTLDRVGNNGYNNENYTNTFSGTSAACPQVSGVAALILSINPNLSRQQVEEILFSSATDLGVLGKDTLYGYGKVNAFKSVQKAVESLGRTFNPRIQYFSAPQKIRENQTIIFSGVPSCALSATTYYSCDVYESTYNLNENTNWYWGLSRGLSPANPNIGVDQINRVGNTLKTYYYYVRYNSSGQAINKWTPADPNMQNNRKILVNDYKKDIVLSANTVGDITALNSITMQNNFSATSNFSATVLPNAGETDVICRQTSSFSLDAKPNNTDWSVLTFVSKEEITVQIQGNIHNDAEIIILDSSKNFLTKKKIDKPNMSINNSLTKGIYSINIINKGELFMNNIIIE